MWVVKKLTYETIKVEDALCSEHYFRLTTTRGKNRIVKHWIYNVCMWDKMDKCEKEIVIAKGTPLTLVPLSSSPLYINL